MASRENALVVTPCMMCQPSHKFPRARPIGFMVNEKLPPPPTPNEKFLFFKPEIINSFKIRGRKEHEKDLFWRLGK